MGSAAITPEVFARPELRQRLVQLHGSSQGYSKAVREDLVLAGQHAIVSPGFLSKVLLGKQTAPAWMVVGLTRIAEDDMELTRDGAYMLSSIWFTVREKEEENG